ncbi:glycosyltransferase family 9 protein [Pseudohongiella sp.]|uniref:Lipopolysaccharide heptosyltransferase II n=1 Tax=marine sediment metagenome TaxID=412755 RepID=A0A0F9YI59_9ZZZZ|nr:glycosyltransferase family 9 protein [Pseudohongiella sp.]
MSSAVNDLNSTVPKRIALINPTKFLGNLLLAGGLIQQLCELCLQHDSELLLVLDESFCDLVGDAWPGARVVYYPRRALSHGVSVDSVRLWLRCVRQIRAFAADLAFTIEEDSVSHRLLHASAARRKVSSTVHRYHWGFDQVLDIPRSGRAPGKEGIWYSYRDVFAALGLPIAAVTTDRSPTVPAYMSLSPPTPDRALLERLATSGLELTQPIAVLHAGASKRYKQWPAQQFVALAVMFAARGYQLVLIGAGQRDSEVNTNIMRALASTGVTCVDLCNRLTLAELASLLRRVEIMVGNDSGPSHLASALGVRGVVLFGPTDLAIWRPLGRQTTTLQHKHLCAPDCTRHHCQQQYICLQSIMPQQVLAALGLNLGLNSDPGLGSTSNTEEK